MIDMDDANDVNSNDTHDINDELHIAVALNHIEETKSLLAQDYNLVNQIDLNGNQPLHIAAQTGCDIEIVKTLIQYDAPIGRRNYEGLTPLGEARFHGKKEIVRLLKRYYRIIGDCKSIDTSIDTTCLGTSIEREEPEKYKYSRIDLESIPSQTLIRKIEQEERYAKIKKSESLICINIPWTYLNISYLFCCTVLINLLFTIRMQKAQLDWLDWWKRKKEHESAMLIQEIIRQYLAKKHAQKLEFERINAIQIQQTWRKYRYKKQQKAATKIQSFQRMVVVKTYFTSFQYERLFWHRASRILAIFAQRLWRGHKGRSQARRLREMSNLPDPSDTSLPYSYDEWVQHQTEAHPPSRTWNMYSEFVLSGKPRTWQERRIKRNGLFYRDVVFWVNNLTQQTSWTQPQKWKILDQQEYIMRLQVIKIGYTLAQHQTACKLQVLWRARVAKRNLSLILRSQRVIKKAIDVYYCDPENIVALCNYTLYIHVVQVRTC